MAISRTSASDNVSGAASGDEPADEEEEEDEEAQVSGGKKGRGRKGRGRGRKGRPQKSAASMEDFMGSVGFTNVKKEHNDVFVVLTNDAADKWDALPTTNEAFKQFRKNCAEAREAFKELTSKGTRIKWTAGKRQSAKPDGAMDELKQFVKDTEILQSLFACCAEKTPDNTALWTHFSKAVEAVDGSSAILSPAPHNVSWRAVQARLDYLFHHGQIKDVTNAMNKDTGLLVSVCTSSAAEILDLNHRAIENW